jgi:hypothetical protein
MAFRHRFSALTLAGLFLALTAGAAPAGQAGMLSHRAVHDLTMTRSESQSGIADVEGRVVLEWQNACPGYTMEQRMVLETQLVEGPSRISDFRYTTWESADGLSFRFSMRYEVDGTVIDEIEGRAKLEGPGGPGEATFSKPDGVTVDLPAGTVFPSEHTLAVVEAGRAGKSMQRTVLFDGSISDGLFDVVSLIGPRKPEEETEKVVGAGAGPHVSWPVRIAFFKKGPEDTVPDYEMSLRLYDNGVSGDLLLDYKEFALKGTVVRIEPLEDGC